MPSSRSQRRAVLSSATAAATAESAKPAVARSITCLDSAAGVGHVGVGHVKGATV